MEINKIEFKEELAEDLFWKLTTDEDYYRLFSKNVEKLEKIKREILNENKELTRNLKITIEVV